MNWIGHDVGVEVEVAAGDVGVEVRVKVGMPPVLVGGGVLVALGVLLGGLGDGVGSGVELVGVRVKLGGTPGVLQLVLGAARRGAAHP